MCIIPSVAGTVWGAEEEACLAWPLHSSSSWPPQGRVWPVWAGAGPRSTRAGRAHPLAGPLPASRPLTSLWRGRHSPRHPLAPGRPPSHSCPPPTGPWTLRVKQNTSSSSQSSRKCPKISGINNEIKEGVSNINEITDRAMPGPSRVLRDWREE